MGTPAARNSTDNDWPRTIIDNQVVTMAKHYPPELPDLCKLVAKKNPTISGEVS
jgi:hypothetical protein